MRFLSASLLRAAGEITFAALLHRAVLLVEEDEARAIARVQLTRRLGIVWAFSAGLPWPNDAHLFARPDSVLSDRR